MVAESDNSLGVVSSADGTLPEIALQLIEKNIVSRDQIEIALREQRRETSSHKNIGAILVDLGFITESALSEVVSERLGAKHVTLHSAALDPKLINMIPKEVALRQKVIPISALDDSITVAMNDVYNIMAIDQLKRYFPRNVRIIPVYAGETDILEAIDQYYHYEMSVEGILKEIETGISEKRQLSGEAAGYVNPTVRLVDSLLVDAIKNGASDIHFEPEANFVRIRYRIDGKLQQIRAFHKEYWPAIVVRIKIISSMNITETRNPQDGRITYNVLGREVDFRVATQPTIHGENIVMRILDKKQSLLPLSDLGFSAYNEQLLRKLLRRPEGIVIVTGPTGSGKTTTLYSILNHINTVEKNIMTLEDPVEYQLSLIRQSNVREGTGMNFTDGIRSLMRQDPDIIFIGEVRDSATASMAVRAAMTGHQVYSTLHTNDALGAIPRLVDIGVAPTLLAGSLICVIAQRLARRLCDHCKESYVATSEDCRILGVDSCDHTAPTIYRHRGCSKCYGGYKGRISITEIIPVDRELDELIASKATRKVMIEYLESQGFVPMSQDGAHKVMQGILDVAELIDTIDMTSRL
jgi:type IV pilus assembly protein PilB